MILSNSWHVISAWIKPIPNTVFTGIAHYYADYFLYVSLMAQKGWVFTDHLFTNEALSPTWIYWLYTLLGKLGNPFVVYTVSIIVFSATLLWLLWHLVRAIFPDKPVSGLTAFLFVTTASNFAGGGDFWFSPTPALNRLGGVPHQIVQTILLLLVVVQFSKSIQHLFSHQVSSIKYHGQKNIFSLTHNTIPLILLSFLAAAANPIQMLLITISTTCFFVLDAREGVSIRTVITALAAKNIWGKSDSDFDDGRISARRLQRIFITYAVLAVPAFVGAYAVNAEFSHQPILAAAKIWEDSQRISINLFQFLRALGPIGLLLPFGIIRYVKNLSPLRIFIGIYGIVSTVIFLSPIPGLLSTTPVRWISPASFLLFPLLAAEGLKVVAQLLHRISKKTISRTFWFTTILCLYIIATIPSLRNQINARANNPYNLAHVPNQVVTELQKIKQMSDDSVVLVDPALPYDVLIPVFTGHKTFTGHPIHTLYPDTKKALRQKYFAGNMTEPEKQQFLMDHHIRWIISKDHESLKIIEVK